MGNFSLWQFEQLVYIIFENRTSFLDFQGPLLLESNPLSLPSVFFLSSVSICSLVFCQCKTKNESFFVINIL